MPSDACECLITTREDAVCMNERLFVQFGDVAIHVGDFKRTVFLTEDIPTTGKIIETYLYTFNGTDAGKLRPVDICLTTKSSERGKYLFTTLEDQEEAIVYLHSLHTPYEPRTAAKNSSFCFSAGTLSVGPLPGCAP